MDPATRESPTLGDRALRILGRVPCRARPRNHAGGLEDIVGLPKLLGLAAQPAQLVKLAAAGQIVAYASVGLCLAHQAAQRLRTDVQIPSDLRHQPTALHHRLGRPYAMTSLDSIAALAWTYRCFGWGRL